jgi:peptidoglycan/xylan/chitin deacetylase (PgdA/CDA1 family)
VFNSKNLRVFLALLVLFSLFIPTNTFANGETGKQEALNYLWVEVGSSGAILVDSIDNGETVLNLSPGIQLYGHPTDDGWLLVTLNSQTYYLDLKTTSVLSEKTIVPEASTTFVEVSEGTILKSVGDDAKTINILKEISLPTNGQQLVDIGETSYTVQIKEENIGDQTPINSNLDKSPISNNEVITFDTYFKVSKKTVIYDKPSTDSKIIGYLLPGETFKRTKGSSSDWHEISFGGKAHYVNTADTVPMDSYDVSNQAPDNIKTIGTITVTGEAPVYDNTRKGQGLVQFASVASGETYPIVRKLDADWFEVIVNGRLGYIYKSIVGHVSMPFQNSDHYFKVTVDHLPVYINSGGKLIPIGSLVKGQVYPRVSDYDDWHKISFDGMDAFVWKDATEHSDGKNIKNLDPGNTGKIGYFRTSSNLTVYDNTSGSLIPFGNIQGNINYSYNSDWGDWLQVSVGGRIGFVYKKAVKLDFKSTDKYFKPTMDNVTVYDNSSGKLVNVGTLIKDQVYPRIGDYGDWHQISFGDKSGFVWKDATQPADANRIKNLAFDRKGTAGYFKSKSILTVYDNSSGALVPYAYIGSNVKYPYISDWGDWLQVSVGGRIGFVYKPAVKVVFNATDRFFKPTEDNVTVYDTRSGKLVPVATLKKGQVYPRVSDYGDWHQISLGNFVGYVWKDATEPANGNVIKDLAPAKTGNAGTFKTLSSLTVYDNTSGKLIPYANIGSNVDYSYISDWGDWLQVSVSGRIGYVYKSAVQMKFKPTDKYFKPIMDNLTVYENSNGKLVPIGTLDKNRIYSRISDYGDWHQIKYANRYGYVWENSTTPVDVSHRQFLTILTYHNLTNKVSDGANISPTRFREHMKFFKDKGFKTITMDQLLNFLNGAGSLPEKPLMITLDDSYLSQYTEAYPILKELGMKATIFTIAGWVGHSAGTLPEFTWDQARIMEASGVIDIESHTYASHDAVNGKPYLTSPFPGETNEQYINRIRYDLITAKSILESQLGKRIRGLAYPFGSWNETVKNVAKDAGYEALFLYDSGPGIVYSGEDPLIINRYGVDGNMSAYNVWSKFLQ